MSCVGYHQYDSEDLRETNVLRLTEYNSDEAIPRTGYLLYPKMIGYFSYEKNDYHRDWKIKEMLLTFQKRKKKSKCFTMYEDRKMKSEIHVSRIK